MKTEDLLGKVVAVDLGSSYRLCGRYYGLVRRARGRWITIQRPSNPDASSRSARYRGDKIRCRVEDVLGVFSRKKLVRIEH